MFDVIFIDCAAFWVLIFIQLFAFFGALVVGLLNLREIKAHEITKAKLKKRTDEVIRLKAENYKLRFSVPEIEK